MSTMVEATLPGDQFALHETLEEINGAEFEVVRMVAHGDDRVMPFIWATAEDFESLSEAIRDDPSTENVEVLSRLDGEYLLRMDWMAHIRVILYILLEEEATILDAYGKNDTWQFRILFPEHDSVSATYDFCEEYGIDLDLERIYQLSGSFRRGQFGLTEDQYQTLTDAYERGYYEVPRETNLEELADGLDVSHQALSERLRRGHGTLIANALRSEIERTASPDPPTS